MHWLGRIYGGQERYPENPRKAVHWLTLAAEAGDAQSQCLLGVCYINGYGVKADAVVGAAWYRRAGAQGDEWAAYLLGLCYRDGTGVRRNRRLARHWFKKAALRKVKEAVAALKALPSTRPRRESSRPGKRRRDDSIATGPWRIFSHG